MADQGLANVAVNHLSELNDRLHDFTHYAWTNTLSLVQVEDRAKMLIHEYIKEYSSSFQSIAHGNFCLAKKLHKNPISIYYSRVIKASCDIDCHMDYARRTLT